MQEFLRRFGIPVPRRGAPRPGVPGTPAPGGSDGDDEPARRGVGSGVILIARASC